MIRALTPNTAQLFHSITTLGCIKPYMLVGGTALALDKLAIGAMKMEVMLRRSTFRDYYDIYSLLKDGANIKEMINLALRYSQHKLKTRNIVSMLTNGERFVKDKKFDLLDPIYDVTPMQIQEYISNKLKENPI